MKNGLIKTMPKIDNYFIRSVNAKFNARKFSLPHELDKTIHKGLLFRLEDFSDYNDLHYIFMLPTVQESSLTRQNVFEKLTKDRIGHLYEFNNKVSFFYISNEEFMIGYRDGETLSSILDVVDGTWNVYAILSDLEGQLYLHWRDEYNADAYVPPWKEEGTVK